MPESDDKPASPPPAEQVRPIPLKGKASKAFVRRLIDTGRYTINTLDGTPITDWKRLFADIHEPSAAAVLDGEAPLPVADLVQPSPPLIQVPRADSMPASVVVGDKKYTNRQLEHFGDALVALAGRLMVHEKCGTDQRMYFNFASQMITNNNLGRGDVRRGTAAEIEIGLCFVESGFGAAMECARAIIEKTEGWQNLVKLMEPKISKPADSPVVNEVREDQLFCLDGQWFPWRAMTPEQKAKVCTRKIATAQADHDENEEKWWSNVKIT